MDSTCKVDSDEMLALQQTEQSPLKCKKSVAHEPKYIMLAQWMKSHGFTNGPSFLLPADFKGTGRGLLAKKDVKVGEQIIAVPRKLLLTTATVFDSFLGPILKSWHEKLSPIQVIGVFLVCERHKGENSFWAPYLRTLPISYTNATYWNQEDITVLPEFVQTLAVAQRIDVQRSYDKLRNLLMHLEKECPQMKAINFCDYQWAWSTINTRSVHMIQEKNKFLNEDMDNFALVPFLDLMNHAAEVEVKAGFDHTLGSYQIKALSPIKRDNQAFINYGPHSNAKLLVEYGFVLPDNPNNFIPVNLEVLSSFAKKVGIIQCQEKLRIISEHGKHRDMYFSKDGASWNLSIALRILCLSALKDIKVVLSGQDLSKSHETRSQSVAAELVRLLKEDMLDSFRRLQIPTGMDAVKASLARSLYEDCLYILEKCAQFYE